MKVPTYKRQLQRTDRTGAGMLTAQLDPNVMALAGRGLANVGQQMFDFGAEMLEVETKKQQLAVKNESSQAVQNLNTELKDIRLTADKMKNPHEAEAYWVGNSQKVYTDTLNSLSKDARTLFTINGNKLKTDLNYDFLSKNDPKILEHTKKLAKGETAIILDNASNPDNSLAVRTNALISVIGGNQKNTDNFKFAQTPVSNVGYSRAGGSTEKEENLLNYHRLNIANNTYLENADKSITTVYITGIRNPAEGENSPIYAVPGYYNGKKYSKEEEQELQEIATEEGWFDVYPSDPDAKSHKKRVNKLHKLIDKDGKNLSKIEKTFTKGLNYKLLDGNIVDYNEFTALNQEALTTVATNTISHLMNKDSDAHNVIHELMEGTIKDPILNMIWEGLPIEEKDKIIKKSITSADTIEKFKANEIKEEEDQITKEENEFYKKMINVEDYEEAKSRFDLLKEMNFFDTPAKLEAALKFINKKKGGEDENWTFRSSADGSVGAAIRELENLDLHQELSLIAIDSRADKLTQADHRHYMNILAKEQSEGVKAAIAGFRNAFGFTEELDVEDRLNKIIKAAFFDASDKINKYEEENPEVTYRNILNKRDEILKDSNEMFKNELHLQRIDNVQEYSQIVDGWSVSDNLTNAEVLGIIEQKRYIDKPQVLTDAKYRLIKANFLYFQLKEIDQQ